MRKISPKGEFGRRVYLTQKEIEFIEKVCECFCIDAPRIEGKPVKDKLLKKLKKAKERKDV